MPHKTRLASLQNCMTKIKGAIYFVYLYSVYDGSMFSGIFLIRIKNATQRKVILLLPHHGLR